MDRKSIHPTPAFALATSCSACWQASIEKTEGVASEGGRRPAAIGEDGEATYLKGYYLVMTNS